MYVTYIILKRYVAFIISIEDYTRLVFADKKLMKETNMYGYMRRTLQKVGVPVHEIEANANNWYNILAAVPISRGTVKHVEFVILE